MQPAEIQKLYHTHGDTWEGLTIGPVTFDGGQPPYVLADCRLYFRRRRTSEIGYKLKTTPGVGEGTLSIDNAVTWLISAPEQELPLDLGEWDWDFETTDSQGTVRTLFKGVYEITREHTHDG